MAYIQALCEPAGASCANPAVAGHLRSAQQRWLLLVWAMSPVLNFRPFGAFFLGVRVEGLARRADSHSGSVHSLGDTGLGHSREQVRGLLGEREGSRRWLALSAQASSESCAQQAKVWNRHMTTW